jgi:predicted MFS family arabinose efflux permease
MPKPSKDRPHTAVGAQRVESGAEKLASGALAALLVLVTCVQALATFSVLALPTLATQAAPMFGVGAEVVGYQISVVYASAAMLSSIAGLYVRRWGGVTVSCVALLLSASGIAAVSSGRLAAAIAGSMLIGFAYGLTNPAASHLLFRFAPRHRQNLIFALKQTGVPLGGMLAASLLPALATRIGWQAAMLWSSAIPVLLALLMWIVGARHDSDRNPAARLAGGVADGVRTVLADDRLRSLTVMGCAYALLQFCLFTFLVTMLVEEFRWSLVAAGGMATIMQVGGATGRVAWSLLADWTGRAIAVLVAVGLLSAACALLLSLAGPSWPPSLLGLLLVTFGFSIVGWNGLWMAEIARTSRPGEVGLATGGVLVFTYVGIVLGPATFATVYKLIGSYGVTYAIFSVFALIGALAIGRSRGRRPS